MCIIRTKSEHQLFPRQAETQKKQTDGLPCINGRNMLPLNATIKKNQAHK
jgi:hypothetical protein